MRVTMVSNSSSDMFGHTGRMRSAIVLRIASRFLFGRSSSIPINTPKSKKGATPQRSPYLTGRSLWKVGVPALKFGIQDSRSRPRAPGPHPLVATMTLTGRPRLTLLLLSAITLACTPPRRDPSGPAPMRPGANPLLTVSPLPYQAPRFDLIRNEHYEEAIEEGMRQELAEIDAIAKRMEPPDFENTIGAMERSGQLLTRANSAFSAVIGANTNDTLQKINERLAPKLAAHNDAILLSNQLFRRVKAMYDRRNSTDLSAEQKRLIERYHRNFVRAGAELSEAEKIPLKALNQEQSKLATEFGKRLLAGTRASALVLNDRAELEGLSEAEIEAAAAAAKSRGLTGKWVIPLQNTKQQPAQDRKSVV